MFRARTLDWDTPGAPRRASAGLHGEAREAVCLRMSNVKDRLGIRRQISRVFRKRREGPSEGSIEGRLGGP
eukprot:942241-Pyramimonas_sp.AAC.1